MMSNEPQPGASCRVFSQVRSDTPWWEKQHLFGSRMEKRQAASVLAALAHDLRLELWQLLVPCGAAGLSAGLIAQQLSIPPSSLSFHLQQMAQAGLLLRRRSSRQIIYAVNDQVMGELWWFLASAGRDTLRPYATPRSAGEISNIIS
jgi:ArsR family transcriptional regulator